MEKEASKIEVRDIRDSDWYWVSRFIYEDYAHKIGAIGLALYNAYASYARDKGSAFPSQKTISKKLGVGISTIKKYNKALEDSGLIKIERRRGKPNLIILLKVEGSHLMAKGWSPDTYLGSHQMATKENNIKENTKEVESKDSSVKEIFSYFRSRVKEVKGFDPEISWGKDGRMVKLRLKKYGPDQVKDLIDWYLVSNFCERLGVSLATCLSTYIINLYKSEMASQPLYPLWKPPKT